MTALLPVGLQVTQKQCRNKKRYRPNSTSCEAEPPGVSDAFAPTTPVDPDSWWKTVWQFFGDLQEYRSY